MYTLMEKIKENIINGFTDEQIANQTGYSVTVVKKVREVSKLTPKIKSIPFTVVIAPVIPLQMAREQVITVKVKIEEQQEILTEEAHELIEKTLMQGQIKMLYEAVGLFFNEREKQTYVQSNRKIIYERVAETE